MSTVWVLILWVGGGLATAEFGSEAACQTALIKFKESYYQAFSGGICVQKDVEDSEGTIYLWPSDE